MPERERFELPLGFDLSGVRVHDGPPAETVAAGYHAHALTYGSHIVLGRSAQRAPEGMRLAVFAHELVHVGQQAGSRASTTDSVAHHQPRGPPHTQIVPRLSAAPVGVQCLDEDDSSIIPQWASEAAGAVAEFGEGAWETTGGRAVDFALESAAVVVDRLAPGLLTFLRGGALGQLTDLFCSGVDTLLGQLFPTLGDINFMSAIESSFTGLTENVVGIQSAIGGAASSALGSVLGPLVEALAVWGGPLVDTIQSISDRINGVFSGVWDHLAVPALDFLSYVGGGILDGFTRLVTWVWDVTAPIRNTAETAWNWLLDTFDLAWESTSGVREWLGNIASTAWDAFVETIEPIREPLMVAGGVLLLLSPLGPVILLTQVVPPLWEKITWLWDNWNTQDILVRAQDILREEILPGILGTVSGVAIAFAGAAEWLATTVGEFGAAMQGVLGAFGGSRCLAAITTYLNGVADQFARLAAWAQSGFAGLHEAMQSVLDALVAIFRPILDFLIRMAMVAANPPLLPIALTAAIWLLCPDDLKPPVINFVLDLLIAFITGFPAFLLGLGPLASVMKAGVLGFLRHLRGGEGVGNQECVDASNKMANLAAGGGLEFIGGLAFGLLHGLIDGIIDPCRLIFMIGRVLVLGAQAVGRVLGPLVLETVPGLALGMANFRDVMAVPAVAPAVGGEPAVGPTRSMEGTIPDTRAPPSADNEALGSNTLGSTPASESGVEDVPRPLPGDRTDREIAAAVSPGLAAELVAAGAEPALDEGALETEMRAEVETEGTTVGGLARLLGEAWDWIISGAEGLGARAAGALLEFIMLPDFQLGRKLGFVTGFVLLQLLIAYFTAGGYTAVQATAPLWRQLLALLLRFLDLGGELLAVLGRALRPLRGPLMSGLGAARGFLSRFRFARTLIERIERLAGSVFRFGDEAADVGARGAREAAEETGERVSREAVEETGERTTREAVEAASERGTVEAADDLGPGALHSVDEPGVPTIRDEALRAAEFPRALGEAAAIEAAQDAIPYNPVSVALGALMLLKRRYRWIDRFTATPLTPGLYEISLVASPGTPIGRYSVEGLSSETEARLQAVLEEARRMGFEPDVAQLRRLAREDPEAFSVALTNIEARVPAEAREAIPADNLALAEERAHLAGEIGDPLSTRQTPGRPEPHVTEAGNLVHGGRNAEALRRELGSAPIPNQFTAEVAAGDIITLDQLPDGLLAEVPLGVTSRVDRITHLLGHADGIIYDLKPNTIGSINEGLEQLLRYVNLANAQRWGGRADWRGVIVVYDTVRARAFVPR